MTRQFRTLSVILLLAVPAYMVAILIARFA